MAYTDKNKQREVNKRNQRKKRAKDAEINIYAPLHADEREACRFDLRRFMLSFLPQLFPIAFSTAHDEVIATMQRVILEGGQYALAMPRGYGKSTITLAAVLWGLIYSHRHFLVDVQATARDARNFIQKLKEILEWEDSAFGKSFPEIVIPFARLNGSTRRAPGQTYNGQRTKIVYGIDRLIFPVIPGTAAKGQIIWATSCESSIRGISVSTPDKDGRPVIVRPSMVLLDDLETDESSHSPSSIERITRIITKDIAALGGRGDGKLAQIMLCTVNAKGCVADNLTDAKKNSAWHGRRFSAILQFPDNMDKWSEYEAIRKEDEIKADVFYFQNKSELCKGAVLLWENADSEHLKTLMDWRITNGETAFLTEYQSQPPEEIEALDDSLSTRDVTARIIDIPKDIIPNNASHVVCAVDCGKRILHYLIAAFTPDYSCHIVDYGTFDVPDFPDTSRAVKKALGDFTDLIVKPGWKDEAGNDKHISLAVVDSGYQPAAVVAHCRANYFSTWKPVKGCGSGEKNGIRRSKYYLPKNIKESGIIAGPNWYIGLVNKAILAHVDVDHFKEMIHRVFRYENGESGSVSIHAGTWKDHIRLSHHITAEALKESFIPGKGISRIWQRKSKANHWLDCLVYAYCGASILGIGSKSMEIQPANAPKPTPPPRPKQPKQPRQLEVKRIQGKVIRAPGCDTFPYGY